MAVNRRLLAARLSVLAVFLVNGAIWASWLIHIPFVKEKLALSDSVLGLALLAPALGAFLSLGTSGYLIARFGSRRVTTVSALGLCAALPLPVLAPDLATLALALFFFGLCNGAMDVAMNAQGVAVEVGHGRPLLSGFHAMFSLGGLLGAAAGGLLLARGVGPPAHLLGTAVVLGLVSALAAPRLLPADAARGERRTVMWRPTRAVVGLGILAFLSFLSEGAMADWGAVYLREVLGSEASFAALGYAAFSLAMGAGRLLGDGLRSRFSAVRLVRAGGALAGLGLGGALLLNHPLAALAGFACVGLGLSNVVPLLFGAAGRTSGVAAGTAIAFVATVGYAGFLLGPPSIGFVAQLTGLPVALGLVAVLMLALAWRAGLTGGADRATAGERGPGQTDK